MPEARPRIPGAHRRAVLLAAVALGPALLPACRRSEFPPLPSAGSAVPPGTYRGALVFEGRTRRFLLHVPPATDLAGLPPLVLNFHGGGGNAEGHFGYTGMDEAADLGGFLIVVPDGTGLLEDRLLTWNSGGCCGYARDNDVDDVGFSLRLLAEVEAVVPFDRGRVYATGLSNGAMMAYRLAAEAPQAVAAVAPVAGAMLLDRFDPRLPVPVLHIHSIDDPRALYAGGIGPPFPLTTHRVEHAAVEDVVRMWAVHNGCSPETEPVETRSSLPDPDGPQHTATLLAFRGCPPGGAVRLWKLAGVGHVWPGQPRYLESILGPWTDVIDANLEILEFFDEVGRRP